jgi:hypothetical protein
MASAYRLQPFATARKRGERELFDRLLTGGELDF